VARFGEKKRNVYKVWWEIPKERDQSEDRGISGSIFISMTGSVWSGFTLAQNRERCRFS
jgi:hypothetical protein